MRGGPSFYVEHRLKQLSGLGDYPEEYRQRSLTRYFGPLVAALLRGPQGAVINMTACPSSLSRSDAG